VPNQFPFFSSNLLDSASFSGYTYESVFRKRFQDRQVISFEWEDWARELVLGEGFISD